MEKGVGEVTVKSPKCVCVWQWYRIKGKGRKCLMKRWGPAWCAWCFPSNPSAAATIDVLGGHIWLYSISLAVAWKFRGRRRPSRLAGHHKLSLLLSKTGWLAAPVHLCISGQETYVGGVLCKDGASKSRLLRTSNFAGCSGRQLRWLPSFAAVWKWMILTCG